MTTSRRNEKAVNQSAQEQQNAGAASDRWTQLRERYVNTPELEERYGRNKHALILLRRVLMEIDTERERAGISKAELARRIGAHPSAVRRLFSAKSGNPTLLTILGLLDALDIDFRLEQKAISPDSPQQSRASERAARQDEVLA